MKAIGAKSRFILMLFLSEALLIGIIGASMGLLAGVGGAYVLTAGFAPRGPGTGGGQPGAGCSPHYPSICCQ